jgi:glutathione S-transferase
MRTDPAAGLALDLSRLERVAASLGYAPSRHLIRRERLRRINHDLGDRVVRCPPDGRAAVAQAFADADAALPAGVRQSHDGAATDVELLRQKGCLDLGSMLSADQAREIERHLAARPLLVGRAPTRADGQVAALEAVPRDRNYACHGYLDLWQSPHLLELATQDRVLDLAHAYLGCTPTLHAFNAFWALPDRPAEPQREAFHRDIEDFRSLAVFVLLTPVEAATEGGHPYVEGSHDLALLEASLRADGVRTKMEYLIAGTFVGPMSLRLFHRSARRFHGPAGAAFGIDPYGLHRSVGPRQRPQLLLELRFGTFFNEQLFDMRLDREVGLRRLMRQIMAPDREQAGRILRRIPATPRHQFVFRHMIRALS